MRVLVLVKATEDSEQGFRPTPEAKAGIAEMGKFNDELRAAGVLLDADGLKPSSQAKRVAFDGPERKVIDGPFAHWLPASGCGRSRTWTKPSPG